MSDPAAFRTAVRMFLGDGHERFSDPMIDAVAHQHRLRDPRDVAWLLRQLWRENPPAP